MTKRADASVFSASPSRPSSSALTPPPPVALAAAARTTAPCGLVAVFVARVLEAGTAGADDYAAELFG
jgi:hypothetical protein